MSESIRILHIVHILDRGGMESRLMDLYRKLNREKYQYDFYIESGNYGIFDEEVRELGGKVYYSSKKKRNIPDFKTFYSFIYKHPEYKIIYAYNQWAGWYLYEAKKCDVPNRVANARTSLQTKSLKNFIKNLARLNVNRYATHRFAVSNRAGIWLFGRKFFENGFVEVWPNAIDTKKFAFSENIRSEIRKELNLDNDFVMIHVGNIRFEKNHTFLLRVFKELKNTTANAKLLLVGDGSIETLYPLMEELGIRNDVVYLGVRSDIPRLLQAGDIFVFPSLYEGFPGAVLEAEASGLNCIISDSITDEVLLTDHIKMLSLREEPQAWAEAVVNCKTIDREMEWVTIKNAGYDVMDLELKTEQFYDSLRVD